MDNDQLLALFDTQLRKEAQPDEAGARIERDDRVVRQVGDDPRGWNGILWSGLDSATADAVIGEQLAFFGRRGSTFEWKLYGHDLPHDLPQRLLAHGFVPDDEETLMIASLSAGLFVPGPPEGIELVPVIDEAGVALAVEVHDQAFGSVNTDLAARMLAALDAHPDSVIAVVAMAGEAPVSAARMELHPGTSFASLWGGGTVPAWRGRGLYRSLVAFRARIAADHGYQYLQVDASSQSRPILQRLGFIPLTTTTPYLHKPQ